MRVPIAEWQRRLRHSRIVWVIVNRDGDITNLYESEAAANFERQARPKDSRGPYPMYVDDESLAADRWLLLPDPPTP